jgi:thiol-disulfide isomerase/thioredoxin
MAGVQRADSAWLGRFIGWQANLIELYLEEGIWKGRYYSRQYPPDVFTLVPRPGIPRKLSDSPPATMLDPRSSFVFEGITIGGDTVRQSDAVFQGKPVIVDIMGTWCHNCLDEAPLLERLYREFSPQGLIVVGLSLEVTEDPVRGRKNLAIYKQRHGITYPLLYAGSLDEANVEARLRSQLKNFFAYPTTLFINRLGRVQEIHSGFKGPGTGEEYQREIELFYRMTKELVH